MTYTGGMGVGWEGGPRGRGYTYTDMYIYTHTHTHIYIYTHTHIYMSKREEIHIADSLCCTAETQHYKIITSQQ